MECRVIWGNGKKVQAQYLPGTNWKLAVNPISPWGVSGAWIYFATTSGLSDPLTHPSHALPANPQRDGYATNTSVSNQRPGYLKVNEQLTNHAMSLYSFSEWFCVYRIQFETRIKTLLFITNQHFQMTFKIKGRANPASKELAVKGAVRSARTFYHIASRSKDERRGSS